MRPFAASRGRSLILAAVLLAACFTSRLAGAATGPPYEIVDLAGKSYVTTGLAFTSAGLRAATPAGVTTLPGDRIDWYETFYRNIKSGATNVVVFSTGSLLRFDRFELKDGGVILTVAGGGEVRLAESLIDFEKSVREGAMVKLAEGAGATVQVSRSTGGSWSDESGAAASDAGSVASRRRPGRVSPARRAGALGQPVNAEESVMPEELPIPEETPPEDPQPGEAVDVGNSPGGNDDGGGGFGRSPFPNRRSPFDRDRDKDEGGNGGGEGQQSGQAVVTISTDYSGVIGGVQVLLQYPPNLQVVEPVTFTGFASNWLTTPNTTVAGQINIAGVAQPGTTVSGGEFLRVTFVWTGQPPARQLFRISQLQAQGENETLTDFRTTMDVQISP